MGHATADNNEWRMVFFNISFFAYEIASLNAMPWRDLPNRIKSLDSHCNIYWSPKGNIWDHHDSSDTKTVFEFFKKEKHGRNEQKSFGMACKLQSKKGGKGKEGEREWWADEEMSPAGLSLSLRVVEILDATTSGIVERTVRTAAVADSSTNTLELRIPKLSSLAASSCEDLVHGAEKSLLNIKSNREAMFNCLKNTNIAY